ncbi:hypothetical protein DL89DRAFT_45876 [Linderina pennispora]|uniref:F-box domain-containing protein n=1 Tax=Linderina pennispora TaxID=61395 RepID=A0A1Y1W235_9FUNG|nr:uncharacterized protein DL89DRAFT_45876 [Linderina pennispora]ORX67512.1 hypothetical protein DL89DRAFT_45876 [Linderina pennispora]
MTNLRRSRIGSLFRSVKRAMTTKTGQPIARPRSPNHLTQAVSRMSRIFNPALARRSTPLPYDLMHMILAELCSGKGGPAEILQQRLWIFPMTLVSHAWREAALPAFYHSVVCMANRNIDGTLTLQWQPKVHSQVCSGMRKAAGCYRGRAGRAGRSDGAS